MADSVLQSAIASRDSAQISALRPQVIPDAAAVGNGRDGNTVQLEKELAELNKNSLAHMLETQLVTANLNRLRAAISGRSA